MVHFIISILFAVAAIIFIWKFIGYKKFNFKEELKKHKKKKLMEEAKKMYDEDIAPFLQENLEKEKEKLIQDRTERRLEIHKARNEAREAKVNRDIYEAARAYKKNMEL
jgi:preprotein translocase subunit SecF